MTQSVVSAGWRAISPGRAIVRWTIIRATIGTALLLGLFLSTRPLQAQGQGELQVTAQVLPLVPTRQAALDFALDSAAPQPSQLFRVRQVRRLEPARVVDLKREEVIVVVEFLAN